MRFFAPIQCNSNGGDAARAGATPLTNGARLYN